MIEVLDRIPFELNAAGIIKNLHMRKVSSHVEKIVADLVGEAAPIVRPKAVYKISYLENKKDNSLEIDGVTFTSRVLRINLDPLNRVFPYIATCGRELDAIEVPDDPMKGFCLDTIRMSALAAARAYLFAHMERKYALGKTAHMNPGSLEDWPVTEQSSLFSLFGDVEELVGVRLTSKFVMQPLKSISGICFPTEVTFESCQLCPRETCSGRRAPYDPELVKKYEP
jgi:hypothetical protein